MIYFGNNTTREACQKLKKENLMERRKLRDLLKDVTGMVAATVPKVAKSKHQETQLPVEMGIL